MVTNGGGLGLKCFKIILFQHGTTSEMKYNCLSGQNNFISFQTWFHAMLKQNI